MAVNGVEEMNGDILVGNLVGLSDEGGSLEPSECDGNQDQVCKICDNKLNNPRILSCLHVFCETCLEKTLITGAGDSISFDRVVECHICKQETKIGSLGVASLTKDYLQTNILDVSSLDQSVVCTCCKSKEQAVACCSDCSHFLCPNCKSAHEFMRCFENHHVVPFDTLKNSKDSTIHKPIFCDIHTGEGLLFYCHLCEEAVCQECMVREHKAGSAHQCERVSEAEASLRRQLMGLTRRASAKADDCQRTTEKLDETLADLQRQRDEAHSLITEAYQSYKTYLEMAYERAVQQLKCLHSERELKVMDLFNNVDKTVQKIEDACKFTSRLLSIGDATELAVLKKVISAQILYLVNNTPKLDINFSLEFETNFEKFENMVNDNFGKFKTEIGCNDMSSDNGIASGSGSMPTSPGTAVLPVSMQSSFNEYTLAPTGLPALPSIVEYNLQQLASLVEKDSSAPQQHTVAPPQQHTSPGQQTFTLADLLAGDLNATHAFNNLQALAKLDLNADEMNGVGSGVPVGPGRSPPLLMGPSSPHTPLGSMDDTGLGAVPPSPYPRTSKATPMHIRYKFGQLGNGKGHFNSPHGFCLGNEEDIIVADTNNHRITVFEKSGAYKFHFGSAGKEEGQLWYPRKVAVMRNTGKFVVCDRGNERSRMQIFTKNGHFLKKIAVRYIDIVAGLAVTQQGHIVAVDSVTPTVFVISENGDLLSWFDCSECMREPSDIAISGKEFYVCDFKGHCVVVFSETGTFLRRIGFENVTNFPNGIDVSDAGDVLIGDSHGNKFHVAVFSREGNLVTEFECPYVKVSRCCGLKITSEGYIVTLAKNNHHVLVLNTLYIM